MPIFLFLILFFMSGALHAQPSTTSEYLFKKFDKPSLAPDPDAEQSSCSTSLNKVFYSTLGLYSEEELYCSKRKPNPVPCLKFNYYKVVALRDLIRSMTCETGTAFRMPDSSSEDYIPKICSEVITLNQLYLDKTAACKK